MFLKEHRPFSAPGGPAASRVPGWVLFPTCCCHRDARAVTAADPGSCHLLHLRGHPSCHVAALGGTRISCAHGVSPVLKAVAPGTVVLPGEGSARGCAGARPGQADKCHQGGGSVASGRKLWKRREALQQGLPRQLGTGTRAARAHVSCCHQNEF